jgi:hypothetical protein
MSYAITDPYAAHTDSRSVDCKVVLMGNTGMLKTAGTRLGATEQKSSSRLQKV